jgi:hypothetical protein
MEHKANLIIVDSRDIMETSIIKSKHISIYVMVNCNFEHCCNGTSGDFFMEIIRR